MLDGAQAKYGDIMKMILMLIDKSKAESLLESDPDDNAIHECLLSNGRFLFQSDNGNLIALYKVIGASE